jgi:hypothetical protein
MGRASSRHLGRRHKGACNPVIMVAIRHLANSPDRRPRRGFAPQMAETNGTMRNQAARQAFVPNRVAFASSRVN